MMTFTLICRKQNNRENIMSLVIVTLTCKTYVSFHVSFVFFISIYSWKLDVLTNFFYLRWRQKLPWAATSTTVYQLQSITLFYDVFISNASRFRSDVFCIDLTRFVVVREKRVCSGIWGVKMRRSRLMLRHWQLRGIEM